MYPPLNVGVVNLCNDSAAAVSEGGGRKGHLEVVALTLYVLKGGQLGRELLLGTLQGFSVLLHSLPIATLSPGI